MVKPKTKKQTEQDIMHLTDQYVALSKATSEFVQEIYDSEFNLKWIRVGVISDIMEATNDVRFAEKRVREDFTFTSHEEDHKHAEWDNCTHIGKYNEEE